MKIRVIPIINKPALIIENKIKILAIADIHLGIEWDLYKSGFSIPTLTTRHLDKVQALIHEHNPDRLVFVGDIKHNVPSISWQERNEVPLFLNTIADKIPLDIFPGNHDGGIELLYGNKNIALHSSKGGCIDGIGYFHGHTWPNPEILEAPYVITAHNHPTIRFRDKLGYTYSDYVWVRSKFDIKTISTSKNNFFSNLDTNIDMLAKSEVIIMPPFNDICGGISINEIDENNLIGPAFTSGLVDFYNAEIYLLDGTRLGKVKDIKKVSRFKK
ncbi:metallophosphoesterase [Methanosalsum natronophilum]|uniref:metallophosphoesterase n=1 Tax=Methanosalsum natronophilum TaxID=768733 RepID=UPI00216958FE|nr:metallophosphoesterase [Methanosalsum natronophilum]MCS3924734.1 metallophosphoesterase superfamily enzyme [Methanosalsum natronophilum]